jgi:hypothetical protein
VSSYVNGLREDGRGEKEEAPEEKEEFSSFAEL